MKIASIKASAHSIEVPLPLFDKRVMTRKMVVVEVETDEGIVGYGVTGGQFLAGAVTNALETDFLDLLRGMDPRDTEAIHEQAWWNLNPRAMTGVFSMALSAIDIALWDIKGKAAGRTVAQLLGGARDSAPIYMTFGYPFYDYDRLIEAARIEVNRGVRRFKMVVGAHEKGWREDARRVRGVRDAIGDDVELMIDGNHKFSPVEAKLLCRAIEDCSIEWFEEPLHQNDVRALADLRRSTSIPLSAGQMEGNRARFRDLVYNSSIDIVQPNVCFVGGYTEAQKIGHMAQAFNMKVANGGGWPLYNLHIMAGLMNGWRCEFHVGIRQFLELIYRNPPLPDHDRVKVSDGPGLGLEPNFDVLRDTVVTR